MRLLFVATQLPFPPDTGGRIRTLNMLKHLAYEHDVTFVCTVDVNTDSRLLGCVQDVCSQFIPVRQKQYDRSSWRFYLKLLLNIVSSYPVGVAKDHSPALMDRLQQLLIEQTFDVLVCDFLHASINLRDIRSVPIILFQHNVEAEIFHRHYLHAANCLMKIFWLYQWRKMKRYEGQISHQVDHCIAVSQKDKYTFERDYELNNVSTIDTGVDVGYFAHYTAARIPNRLVFTGSMDWLPNEDAMLFFVHEIFPLIAQVIPSVSLAIVGRYPSSRVRRLSQASPEVIVTGRVADVRPYLAEGEVFIVPLRIGGGTRIKIFEAMASNIPVVSTTVGAEGLLVEDQRHLLLADTPEDFAKAVITLLQDACMAQCITEMAKSYVAENSDWKIVVQQFAEICRKTMDQRKVSPDEN